MTEPQVESEKQIKSKALQESNQNVVELEPALHHFCVKKSRQGYNSRIAIVIYTSKGGGKQRVTKQKKPVIFSIVSHLHFWFLAAINQCQTRLSN